MSHYIKALVAVWAIAIAVAVTGSAQAATWPAKCASARLHFSGNGSKDLRPFKVRNNSQLYWRAAGNYFFLMNMVNSLSAPPTYVMSKATHGTTFMHHGPVQLSIGAVGAWRVCILPG